MVMRIIKPGKLGIGVKDTRTLPKRPDGRSPLKEREIWDDYELLKPAAKKREYELGAGKRMIPKSSVARTDTRTDGAAEGVEVEGRERYQPRSDFEIIEEKLSYSFNDRSLLSRALTHRSALGMKERADYERLEFLGDAVLDLSVAHLLSDLHPEAKEGELSKMRAALVNTQALAQIAKTLELGPFIRLGRGEFSSGGAERPSILADVMEAVIGAVYRDSNFDIVMKMIETIFGSSLEQVTPSDPKTELQEALHAAGSEPPQYLLELVEGPEHAPTFVTVVMVDGEIVGRGRGPTKKAAHQAAAAEALARLTPDVPVLVLPDTQIVLIAGALLSVPTPRQNGASGNGTPGASPTYNRDRDSDDERGAEAQGADQ